MILDKILTFILFILLIVLLININISKLDNCSDCKFDVEGKKITYSKLIDLYSDLCIDEKTRKLFPNFSSNLTIDKT